MTLNGPGNKHNLIINAPS